MQHAKNLFRTRNQEIRLRTWNNQLMLKHVIIFNNFIDIKTYAVLAENTRPCIANVESKCANCNNVFALQFSFNLYIIFFGQRSWGSKFEAIFTFHIVLANRGKRSARVWWVLRSDEIYEWLVGKRLRKKIKYIIFDKWFNALSCDGLAWLSVITKVQRVQ